MYDVPEEWLDRCKALIPSVFVWELLGEWDWREAWDTGLSPVQAVHCALLDVLAPTVGEMVRP